MPSRSTKSPIAAPPEFVIPTGLKLTAKDRSRLGWEFTLEGAKRFEKCARCANPYRARQFKRFGRRVTHFLDRPIANRPVCLTVWRYRYSCRICNHVFSPPVRELDEGRRGFTLRLSEFLKHQVLDSNFAELAAATRVSIPTLSRLSTERIHELERERERAREIPPPRFLGVFACNTVRRRFCIITDVQKGTFIDLLPNDQNHTIEQWVLRNSSTIKSLEVIQIDLCRDHRAVLRRCLPNINIITSWRCLNAVMEHVLVRATSRLGILGSTVRARLKKQMHLITKEYDSLNKAEMADLEFILKRHPYLRQYHELKERFDTIRLAANRSEARSAYREWRNVIPTDQSIYFEPVLQSARRV
jgi:transposase